MILERTAIVSFIYRVDIYLCLIANKACQKNIIKQIFTLVSRLGNGVFWYSLIISIPFIYGFNMVHVSVRMALVGIAGLLIYKLIKSVTERPRPYKANSDITLGTAALDQYSFPSGHTLHAVSFTLIAVYYLPQLSWILIPFTMLIALSRVVLGLHYPTDVIAGVAIGFSLAMINILLF